MQQATRRQLTGAAAITAVVVVATAVLSPSVVLDRLARLSSQPALLLAGLLGLYLVRPALLWPISLLSMVAGFGFGLWGGLAVAFAGATLTNLPPFLLARYARTDAGVVGSTARVAERVVSVTGAFRGIVAARLAPSQADVVSYAAGLSDVSLRTYVAATFVGEIPWIVAAVLAGDSMRTLSARGVTSGLELVVAASALAVLLLAGPVYRRVDARGRTPE